MKSPYYILGLPDHASIAEVKKAYKRLVKKHHPDVSQDPKSAEKFIEIQNAYEAIIAGPKRKKQVNQPNNKPPYRRTNPEARTQGAPKTQATTNDSAHSGFIPFLFVVWNVFAAFYFFSRTFITPLAYLGSILLVTALFLTWFLILKKRHYTNAIFFAVLYGGAFIHLMLALNLVFSGSLPEEIYVYTKKMEGKNYNNYKHVLYLENETYDRYPQIRLVWRNISDFYTHECVVLKTSKGLYGIRVLDGITYVD